MWNVIEFCAKAMASQALPSLKMNKEPGLLPVSARYCRIPLSGQIVLPVAPRYMLTPLQKGRLIDGDWDTGLSLLSMEMLINKRWN